jgi:hypothetical protein
MKEEKDKKADMFSWIDNEDSDFMIYECDALFDDYKDVLETIFSPEQVRVLKCLVREIVWWVDFHNNEDTEAHSKTIQSDMNKFKAQFRNHRHDNTKNYGGKPEY